ncbi:MBL fold metallo-hydrolase [Sphingobacterium corticibacter]|uniref:MBL fold hydrolase n=1 Tax=Sphingobacterium corticibacter TaxID=2171749 RepID=A0A2T8HJ17_9SPHI|nr:MBL fold metallo-hydrolase [Sphingobacterium corticibacter]PVH25405.1 MBL fold hydrolase [Sphingobacterium corticibacter]
MTHKIIAPIIVFYLCCIPALSQNLQLKIYNPGDRGFFPVTSTLVYGEQDAILIDAQFEKKFALELIEEIKSTGKNLKLIYISHRDPDYYFGLDELTKAFPEAQIVSTAQTAYAIEASKDDKLKLWLPQLKADAPTKVIIPNAIRTLPLLEGHSLEIVRAKDNPINTFVWIPSLQAIAGGVSVSTDMHLWMTDTQQQNAFEKWIEQIDIMKALHPKIVIPSHYKKLDTDPKSLDFVREYLVSYQKAAVESVDAENLIKVMAANYPKLTVDANLNIGAKVVKGELEWKTTAAFPAIDHHIRVDYGNGKAYEIEFVDNRQLRFLYSYDNDTRLNELIEYAVKEVSPNVFMVSWKNNNTAKVSFVQIQNWNSGVVFSNNDSSDNANRLIQGTVALND